jgi:hypothetical protein
MTGRLLVHAGYCLNEDIIVSFISYIQGVVQRPVMNCFKNEIYFFLNIEYSKTIEQILFTPKLVVRERIVIVIK